MLICCKKTKLAAFLIFIHVWNSDIKLSAGNKLIRQIIIGASMEYLECMYGIP